MKVSLSLWLLMKNFSRPCSWKKYQRMLFVWKSSHEWRYQHFFEEEFLHETEWTHIYCPDDFADILYVYSFLALYFFNIYCWFQRTYFLVCGIILGENNNNKISIQVINLNEKQRKKKTKKNKRKDERIRKICFHSNSQKI